MNLRNSIWPKLFSNLGLNVCRNVPAIANHTNANVKVSQLSTICTNGFDINIEEKSILLPDMGSAIDFLFESVLYRRYNTILPLLGPFHRHQGWTGCRYTTD